MPKISATQAALQERLRRKNRLPTAQGIKQAAKQAGAGIYEATIANAARDGSYVPAITTIPGTIAGLIGSLINRRRDGRAFDGSNVAERFVNASLAGADRANQRANRTFRTTNPKTTSDTFFRVLPTMLVPAKGGAALVKAATRVAPKTVKATAKAVAAVPKPIKAVGRGALELALPVRSTKTVAGTAAALGVATGVGDVLGEKFDPEYESSLVEFDDNAPADFFDDVEAAGTTAEAEPDFFDDVEATTVADADLIEEEAKLGKWEAAGIALAGLALGTGAIKYGRTIIDTAINSDVELPKFTGKKFRSSRGGVVERFKTNVVQQDQPLRNAADEFLSPQHAAGYKHNADLINNVSIGARAASFFRTGKAPKTTIRTNKLAPEAEAYAKELSLDEQRGVSDALLAQSTLDDFDRTGTLASLNLDKNGQPVSVAQLRATVAAARSNPKYVKYMNTVTRSYQDLLKFRVERGLISPEMAQELATKRPNYVRMSRDLETEAKPGDPAPFDANRQRAPGYSRNEEDLQGVQGATGVGNPFNSLLDDWASNIRLAEHNDLRGHWLENMAQANPALVRRIPNGVTPNTMDGIHQVYRNGKLEMYKVSDAILSDALKFSPRASIKGFEMARQIAQNTITGPLGSLVNGFSFFKSPIYDTTMGMTLRPKDVKLGLINEALSKINPNLNIGALDPTALVSAYTGAARYAWDGLVGSMAQNLSEQLIRENTWFRNVLGDNNVTVLRDRLEQAYENSVKSLMEEQGISSLTMHGTPDPSDVMTGLENITPKFSSAMSAQLANDTLAARAAGEVGPLRAAIANGRSDFAKVRANTIGRTYGTLLEAMHNGFRYSMVAANKSRTTDLAKLASQARRISVDSAQHGGNDALNKTAGSFVYANLSIQSLAAVAERALTNPAQFIGNVSSIALPLIGMHYLALANDPDAAEQHAGKSAVQKASSVTTFGGAEIPVDPILRLMITPFMVTMDHMLGANDGNWNRPWLDAMSSWLEGDEDDDYKQDMSDSMWANLKANAPFAPEALPVVPAALAYYGVDPGMSRITGEAQPIHSQQMSGFDPDQKRTDSLMSGYVETMITALGGSFAQNLLGMADDAHRAYVGTGSVREAVSVGASKYRDTMAKGAGVARPMLFGNYEQTKAVTDTNWQIVKDKETGVQNAVDVYNKNVRGNNRTGVNPSQETKMVGDMPVDDASGTQNAVIGAAASRLQSRLQYLTNKLSDLAKQSESVRNGYITRQEEKNKQINELTVQRRAINLKRRQIIEQQEQLIGDKIGDPDFSFEDYSADNYTAPTAAPVQ